MVFSSASIPATRQQFDWIKSNSSPEKVKQALDNIYNRYKADITRATKLTNVIPEFITGIIFIESYSSKLQNADPNAVNGNAIGLMQLEPAGASDVIWKSFKTKALTPQEIAELRKTMGSRMDSLMKMKYLGDAQNGQVTFVTKQDLLNPSFNILAGSIYLALLIREETTKETGPQLARIIIRYNKGYFTKLSPGTTDQLLASNIPPITKDYILKFAGKNGVLDLQMA